MLLSWLRSCSLFLFCSDQYLVDPSHGSWLVWAYVAFGSLALLVLLAQKTIWTTRNGLPGKVISHYRWMSFREYIKELQLSLTLAMQCCNTKMHTCNFVPLVQETMIKEVAPVTVTMIYENGSRHVAIWVPVSLRMIQCKIRGWDWGDFFNGSS